MKKLFLGLTVAGLMTPAVAQAQEAAVFAPSGGWTADYGDDYCRLIRTFGDGSNELSLALERTQPGAAVRVIMVGNAIKTYRGADEIGYALLPSGASGKTRYVVSATADKTQFLGFEPIFLGVPRFVPGATPPPYKRDTELEDAAGITSLALNEGLTSPVRIETGSLRAPMAAMQACADDLLTVWGLDADKHKTMTVPAIPEQVSGGVLPQGTIPFGDFGKLAGGANQVRVLIGADGKPTGCAIYSPSLSDTLNERICKLVMDKAKFQPAKDAGGQAMASYWMGSPMFLGPPFPGGR